MRSAKNYGILPSLFVKGLHNMTQHNAPYATNREPRTDIFLKSVPRQKFYIGDFVLYQGSVHQIVGVRLLQNPVSQYCYIGYFLSGDPTPPFCLESEIGSLSLLIGLSVRDRKSNIPDHFCTIKKVKDNRLFIFSDRDRFGYWCDFNDIAFV